MEIMKFRGQSSHSEKSSKKKLCLPLHPWARGKPRHVMHLNSPIPRLHNSSQVSKSGVYFPPSSFPSLKSYKLTITANSRNKKKS